jgi:hypothetical protein
LLLTILDTVAKDNADIVERSERIMAYAIVVAIAVSVAAFVAIIVGTWSGMNAADFGDGLWPVVAWAPYIGLPVGIILILALVISSARRRSRSARDSAK